LITDILAHASILDGCQLAGSKIALFRHNDMQSLDRRLALAKGRKLVIVEGVYSMDGDMAPLADVADLCRKHRARLMVDEAHSAFVYGAHGRGAAEHFGVEEQVDVHFGTLSKSLGGMGGYVAGSKALVDYLRAYARSHVFSCALSPPIVGGVAAALQIAETEPELRARLWENVRVAREALFAEGVDVGDSNSQVIPIMIRNDAAIFDITRALHAAGVYLKPILYPAVKRHQSRFRVSVSAAHRPDELREGAAIVGRVLKSFVVTQ
jgi:glycine C-acetyltransferase